jgi:hypothetical protein
MLCAWSLCKAPNVPWFIAARIRSLAWWKRKARLPEAALLTIGQELQGQIDARTEPVPPEMLKQIRQLEHPASTRSPAPRGSKPPSVRIKPQRKPAQGIWLGRVRPWLDRRFPERLRVREAQAAIHFIRAKAARAVIRQIRWAAEDPPLLITTLVLAPLIGWLMAKLAQLLSRL